MKDFKKYLAEFIGTGVLVLFACGVAGQICSYGVPGLIGTALAFGLVIVAMAYSIGNVSGCHINPAVSIAMLFSGKMSMNDFIGYVCAQFLGGIVGAGILAAVFGIFFNKYVEGVSIDNAPLWFGIVGMIGAVPAVIGDLAASAIKRNNDIKDYGKLIPGHGGVMDRFDSMIFTAPIIFYALDWVLGIR